MSLLREWILGMVAAALALALAQALTPEGTVKQIGRLVGGLVLALAVLKPVLTLEQGELPLWESLPGGVTQAQTAQTGEEVLKTLIAQKAGAYIVDKGQSLGCEVTAASVTVALEPSGWPVPWSVQITGSWTEAQRQALSRAVEEDLAIPGERQSYQEEGS